MTERQRESIMVQRFALISSLVLATVALTTVPAWASPPTHGSFTFSDTFTAPAGELCDFTYQDSFTFVDNFVVFGDPANPTGGIDHITLQVTHRNLDTGYTLTEVDRYNSFFDASAATVRQVGIVWHLRDPNGKIVVVQAGELVIDAFTGELIKITPNLSPTAAEVICPALGGHPAI
jgi:hypothetical protein